MRFWIDAQISPVLAAWMEAWFQMEAVPVRDLGFLRASDEQIYQAARRSGAVIMSKDRDFLALQERLGPPPLLIWIACGNTSNAELKRILVASMPKALEELKAGRPFVIISEIA